MSANLKPEPLKLKELVASAAAKERRNLGVSIVFTLLVLAVGFGWIAYSAKRVVKLKGEEAELKSSITKAKVELAQTEGDFRKLESVLSNVRPSLDKLAKGQLPTTEEAKIAVAALSSAQETVQVALNNPIKIETQHETPTPTPVLTTVPNVVKMPFADAEQRVIAAGFTAKRVDQPDNGVPGTVVNQNPTPGQRLVAKSQVILYVVPTSSASTTVPVLKGMTFEEASRRILQLGLTVRKVDQPGKGIPGTVLYQDPFEGRRVPVGSQVSIYVIPKGN